MMVGWREPVGDRKMCGSISHELLAYSLGSGPLIPSPSPPEYRGRREPELTLRAAINIGRLTATLPIDFTRATRKCSTAGHVELLVQASLTNEQFPFVGFRRLLGFAHCHVHQPTQLNQLHTELGLEL